MKLNIPLAGLGTTAVYFGYKSIDTFTTTNGWNWQAYGTIALILIVIARFYK